MARSLAAALSVLLVLLATIQTSAWKPGCEDKIIGSSKVFGVVGENKPKAQIDQTDSWKAKGAIKKINLYYSWNYGCLQGIKVQYGYKAGDAVMLGHQKNLYTQHLALADYEHVVKVDIKQADNKCITYIKLYTEKGKTLAFGNAKSESETVTAWPNKKGGFLAAIKGEHDLIDGKPAGLQNLQLVWAQEVCPETPTAVPVEKPDAPEVPQTPVEPEAPTPTEGPSEPETPTATPEVPETPAATPEVPGTPAATPEVPETPAATAEVPETPAPVTPGPTPAAAPACPAAPAMCDATAAEGAANFCPVTSPFSVSTCEGGCCVSSGKCKLPFCRLNNLGADVMALDFICYGKNNGPFGGLNKCRNLGCKLAVPGCQSGLLGGSCVGTVVPLNENVDAMAQQYVGKPCIEVSGHPGAHLLSKMPLGKLGLPFPAGEYVQGLWTVCDCFATSPHPALAALPILKLKPALLGEKFNLFKRLLAGATVTGCQGPMCALLPQLNGMNATVEDLQIPMTLLSNLTSLLNPTPLPSLPQIAGMIPQIQLPTIAVLNDPAAAGAGSGGLTLPQLPTFNDVAGYFVNCTQLLRPAIEALLPAATTLKQDALAQIVANLLPQIRFELPQLDLNKQLPLISLPDLTNLVGSLLQPKVQAATAPAAALPAFDLNPLVQAIAQGLGHAG